MNRKAFFVYLFNEKGYTIGTMAEKIGLRYNCLYRKLIGKNKFYESDIDLILNALGLPYEEVFNKKGWEK